MEDPLAGLTKAQQNRIWAAFLKLNHEYRVTKKADKLATVRAAYAVCARELPHESALALVVHYGRDRALKWFRPDRQTRRYVRYYMAGFAPTNPQPQDPPYQPIPEEDQRAIVAGLVADLIQAGARHLRW